MGPGDDDRAGVAAQHVLTVLATAVSLVALCGLVAVVPPAPPHVSASMPVETAIVVGMDSPPDGTFFYVRPEPLERRLFLVCVFSVPFLVLGWHLAWGRVVGRLSGDAARRLLGWLAAAGAAALGAYCLVVGSRGACFITLLSAGPRAIVAGAVVAGMICAMIDTRHERGRAWLTGLLATAVAAVLVSVFLYSLYDLSTVTDTFAYDKHFNVVFHAMVQVCHGRELLVDYVHQYGLYPHFLEPVFWVVPLGVFSFTVVMGLLVVATFMLIAAALMTFTENRAVALLGVLSLVSGGYVAKVMSNHDPYFQYVPIRTLFPALATWLVARYLASPSRSRQAALYVVSACAVLWNLDTGVVVLAAVVLITLYDEYVRRGVVAALRTGLVGMALSVATVSLWCGWMCLRYGAFPDLGELVRYSRIFYGLGFFMLPMPRVHPWSLVAVVYISGLAWGCAAMVSGRASPRATYAAFLSLLGVGLFSYYQGRSHDETFVLCVYPAFMLVTLFCDWLLREPSPPVLFRAVGLCGVACMAIVAGGLFTGLGAMWAGEAGIVERWRQARRGGATPVIARAAFVSGHAEPGERVLVLSGHSGVFHLISGTTAPRGIASLLEILLREDHERLLRYVQGERCEKVFVDTGGITYDTGEYRRFREALTAGYGLRELSPDGQLALYVRLR